MKELREYLKSLPEGPIADVAEFASMLEAAWDVFVGADAQGMKHNKLVGRMENVEWHPPLITFQIERHGAARMGSTRAELHSWEVDVKKLEATCHTGRYRQLSPRSPNMKVEPLAVEIADLIVNRQEDERLQWKDDGSARVLIGKVVPNKSTFKRTLQDRRKRFHNDMDRRLAPHGWRKVRANVYAPTTESQDPPPAGNV